LNAIRFHQVVPEPLREVLTSTGEVWGAPERIFPIGEPATLIAPSGRGKTTLLSLIYGLRHDYEGRILFDDQDLRSMSDRQWTTLRREKLSMVFQGLRLFPSLTALENILLKNRLTDFKSEQEIRELIDAVGMTPLLEQPCGTLSFGQSQRIAIIRALCQPFSFLLLDEPFSHLDAETRAQSRAIIMREAAEQEAAVILTTLDAALGLGEGREVRL